MAMLVDTRISLSLPEPLRFTVRRDDAKGAVIGHPQQCIGCKAGYREHPECEVFELYGTTAYIKLKDGTIFKGQPNAALRRIILGFDTVNIPGLDKGIPVAILRPRRSISPEYLRSSEYLHRKKTVAGSGPKHKKKREYSSPMTAARYLDRRSNAEEAAA